MENSFPFRDDEPDMATVNIDDKLCVHSLSEQPHHKHKQDVERSIMSEIMITRKLKVNGEEKQVEMRRFRRTKYYVSKEGNIYSKARKQFLKPCADGMGYSHVTLQNKTYRIHRLVYEVWHGQQPEIVHHIDGNPSNNNLDNLEGLTYSEHSSKHNGIKKRTPYDKVSQFEIPNDLTPFRFHKGHYFPSLYKSETMKELYRMKGGSLGYCYKLKKILVGSKGRRSYRIRDNNRRIVEIPLSFFGWQ